MSLPNVTDHKHVLQRRGGEVLRRLEGVKNPVGVEVGVYRGALSACVLRERTDLIWHMVDTWARPEDGSSYAKSGDSVSMLSDYEFEEVFRDACQRVSNLQGAVIRRKESTEAAKDFQDGSLDVVFIDGDHSDEGVRADVLAWFPKVKKGGYLGGHDWRTPGKVNGYHVGPAVEATFAEMGIKPDIRLGADRTWWHRRAV